MQEILATGWIHQQPSWLVVLVAGGMFFASRFGNLGGLYRSLDNGLSQLEHEPLVHLGGVLKSEI